jgi:hypothetical protein
MKRDITCKHRNLLKGLLAAKRRELQMISFSSGSLKEEKVESNSVTLYHSEEP